MITFDQFITKWTGKGIDFDGAYGDQCMDLMHQYVVEVLGQTDGRILAAPAAKDVWLTTPFGKDKFEAIANTPTGVPQKGDIVLWGTGIGPYGHVAIFIQGDVNSFRSFDQNFPTGTKCAVTNHPSYKGVLGWLRFKQQPIVDLQKQLDEARKARDDNWNLYQGALSQLKLAQDKASKYDSLRKELTDLLSRFS